MFDLQPGKIHISSTVYNLMQCSAEFLCEKRGIVMIKVIHCMVSDFFFLNLSSKLLMAKKKLISFFFLLHSNSILRREKVKWKLTGFCNTNRFLIVKGEGAPMYGNLRIKYKKTKQKNIWLKLTINVAYYYIHTSYQNSGFGKHVCECFIEFFSLSLIVP